MRDRLRQYQSLASKGPALPSACSCPAAHFCVIQSRWRRMCLKKWAHKEGSTDTSSAARQDSSSSQSAQIVIKCKRGRLCKGRRHRPVLIARLLLLLVTDFFPLPSHTSSTCPTSSFSHPQVSPSDQHYHSSRQRDHSY